MKRIILYVNGVYDVLCGISLLLAGTAPHLALFTAAPHSRLLAYWIITYGVVRVHAAVREDWHGCAALTYVIEGLAFALEAAVDHQNMVLPMVVWVTVSSLAIAVYLVTKTE